MPPTSWCRRTSTLVDDLVDLALFHGDSLGAEARERLPEIAAVIIRGRAQHRAEALADELGLRYPAAACLVGRPPIEVLGDRDRDRLHDEILLHSDRYDGYMIGVEVSDVRVICRARTLIESASHRRSVRVAGRRIGDDGTVSDDNAELWRVNLEGPLPGRVADLWSIEQDLHFVADCCAKWLELQTAQADASLTPIIHAAC